VDFIEFINLGEFTIIEEVYFFILLQMLYFLLNGYLLYMKGQTLGKKIMKIKIIQLNGELPPLFKIYGIRYFAINLIYSIPIIGTLFQIVDVLFIFRNDRRCIHDFLAGTKVIVS